jgi:hypothetical protein
VQKNSRAAIIFPPIKATRLSFYLNSLLVNPLKSFTGYYSTLNLSTIKPVNHSTKYRPVAFRLPLGIWLFLIAAYTTREFRFYTKYGRNFPSEIKVRIIPFLTAEVYRSQGQSLNPDPSDFNTHLIPGRKSVCNP